MKIWRDLFLVFATSDLCDGGKEYRDQGISIQCFLARETGTLISLRHFISPITCYRIARKKKTIEANKFIAFYASLPLNPASYCTYTLGNTIYQNIDICCVNRQIEITCFLTSLLVTRRIDQSGLYVVLTCKAR